MVTSFLREKAANRLSALGSRFLGLHSRRRGSLLVLVTHTHIKVAITFVNTHTTSRYSQMYKVNEYYQLH